TPKDLDRGYFSGGELDNRRARNVLRKRDIGSHSHKSSYAKEQRVRSATAHSRHSSYGSTDSIRSPQTYSSVSGMGLKDRTRRASGTDLTLPVLLSKEVMSPIVTKLEYDKTGFSPLSPPDSAKDKTLSNDAGSSGQSQMVQLGQKTTGITKYRGVGLRTISDAITGGGKTLVTSPLEA